jgi:hypothetical protein
MNGALVTLLYGLAGALLLVTSLYLWIRERQSASARWFVLTCLSLLGWLVTLFLFQRSSDQGFVLLVGRLNFAVASVAVYGVYRLVRAVAGLPGRNSDDTLLLATLILSGLSALTPWIDQAEVVRGTGAGNHETIYGFLFPLYLIHVVGLLGLAIWTAFRQRREVSQARSHVGDQLQLLGWGIVATGLVSLLTNIALPYGLGNFDYIEVGPLSTVLLLLAVAYAVVRHQLFDIRVFLRRTLVLGIALSLVLAAYSALVLLATDRFASSESGGVTRFGVLVLAFSFDPVRRFLESRIDKLLFPERKRSS